MLNHKRRFSSYARKPKCSDKNRHTVHWSETRLELSNPPASKKRSSLSPIVFYLYSAGCAILDFSNTLSLDRLNEYFLWHKYRCHCLLRWKPEIVAGSHSFFLRVFLKNIHWQKVVKIGCSRVGCLAFHFICIFVEDESVQIISHLHFCWKAFLFVHKI